MGRSITHKLELFLSACVYHKNYTLCKTSHAKLVWNLPLFETMSFGLTRIETSQIEIWSHYKRFVFKLSISSSDIRLELMSYKVRVKWLFRIDLVLQWTAFWNLLDKKENLKNYWVLCMWHGVVVSTFGYQGKHGGSLVCHLLQDL